MSKAGCPYDNAPMERFYNTFKSNFYNVTSFSSVEMMDELTINYINWYNYVRPHSYNDYLTPMEARYRQVFIEQSVTKMLDQYKIHPARALAMPTFSTACAAVLLVAPPKGINAPAMMPSRIIFPSGRRVLFSQALILRSMTSAGVLK